ncbi:iron-containing alcohol dehydrogenase [Heliobacterium chlorum]|uniref:Iron-containing alcohol dehydrogenase n=1 Tax=Heliobacterium chlorum TaxID=2698 RepID=A0ABR7T355_HELCL|nr:1-propanol dehydrogenase PduQ [Heliobacterium chlorum]MBC9785208.1 iron-containing alcohol dehydrogenase [Heliobacterium chlorum]
MKKFNMKPKVVFEAGSIKYLSTLKKGKAFVITDPFMIKAGFAAKILELLEGNEIEYTLFSDIKPDPPIETVSLGVEQMLKAAPDIIIALGGGSTIDAAKAILMFTQDLSKKSGVPYKRPQFIAIPTTSGTGSEVTSFSVITVNNQKVPLVHIDMLPDVAIIDADLVKTVPPQITADTAMDVLTHAFEAYVSKKASDYSDAMAEKAVKLVFAYIVRAYKNGNDIEARERLHNASCLAGMAFNNAMLGINHSIAHAIGGVFHIPHGRANAILLPHVLAYNAGLESENETVTAARYAELAKVLGLPARTVREGVLNLICAVQILLTETNTPMTMKDLGINRGDFLQKVDALADAALADKCTDTNPRKPNKEEIVKIITSLYEG